MAGLRTNYKDDVLDVTQNTRRKYNMITNADGTVSFEDVTEYLTEGDSFGASDINATNMAIEHIGDCEFTNDTAPYAFKRSTHNAVYDKLVGISWVENQLVQNGNFASTDGWYNENATFSVSGNVATIQASAQYGNIRHEGFAIVEGHRYFARVDVNLSNANSNIQVVVRTGSGNTTVGNAANATGWQTVEAVISGTSRSNSYIKIQDIGTSGFNSVQVRNVNVIDLTAMYSNPAIADKIYAMEQATAGSGLAWIRQYGFLNDAYIEYNEGVIESSAPTYRKVVGFNQWDEQYEVGVWNSSGVKAYSLNDFRSKNYIPVFPNTVYYVKKSSRYANGLVFRKYDFDKNFIGTVVVTNANKFTTPANCGYITFCTNTSDSITTYNHDICINISDPTKNGTYEPYKEVIYPLGGDTLRGVPQLVGNDLVADGDIKTSDGVVNSAYGENTDLSALTWEYVSSSGCFKAGIADGKPSATQQGTGKGVCSRYAVVKKAYADMNDGEMLVGSWIGGTTMLYLAVKDSQYGSDATAFKNSLSNVHLVYELKTPTTSVSTPFTSPQVSLETEETDTPCGHDSIVVDIPEWMQNEYFDDVRAQASKSDGVTRLYMSMSDYANITPSDFPNTEFSLWES